MNIFLLANLLLQSSGQVWGVQTCLPQSSCRECIRSPGCAWCTKTDFLQAGESNQWRCDTEEALTTRHCDKQHIINPEAKIEERKNNDLGNDYENVIQLKPQNLNIVLRVGVPQPIKVSFKRAEGYPIDLYYLMDLSFSMKDDLDTIKHLGQDIVNTLRTYTRNIRIGFGSFVDKVALPYVSLIKAKRQNPCPSRKDSCQPAFSFKNILSLTEDAAHFKKEVSRQMISGNLDPPEAGLDAIIQAAVCQDVIGWKNVTKILVYTSDNTFHIAGDGRLAGIYEHYDGKCHLNHNGSYDGTKFDYPSIGHLSRVLTANNIQLIFAVTKDTFADYEELSKLIPQSVAGILENDSSNIVQLISKAYNSLSSTILLEHHGAPQGLRVSYQSHCIPSPGARPDPTEWRTRGECTGIKINQQVDFTVQLNISECLAEKTEFYLKVQGISEKLKVSVETLCDCNCKQEVPSSPHCSGNGTLSCGICSCDSGFQGHRCECEQRKDIAAPDAPCRQNNSQLCSGHGICACGRCMCKGGYKGDFCQCDDNSCERQDRNLCSGNGNCSCGECKCFPSHTGKKCDCSTRTDQCMKEGALPCSGHGICQCNRCECNPGFSDTDPYCSTMIDACGKYEKCAMCISEHEGPGDVQKSCVSHCGSVVLQRDETLLYPPCNKDAFFYEVKLHPDASIVLRYNIIPRYVDKTWVAIGSSVSGIIFIGIIVILISRLLLELHYRREYRSFLRAQENTVWKNQNNPLFQGATTTVMNPLHLD